MDCSLQNILAGYRSVKRCECGLDVWQRPALRITVGGMASSPAYSRQLSCCQSILRSRHSSRRSVDRLGEKVGNEVRHN